MNHTIKKHDRKPFRFAQGQRVCYYNDTTVIGEVAGYAVDGTVRVLLPDGEIVHYMEGLLEPAREEK